MKKCIITVVGKDSVGIIAKVCTYLAETNINILNISQTIVDGYFNMMAVADVENSKKELDIVAVELRDIGTSVLIDRSVMQKACGDEKTAKWLEENLAIMPDVIRNAQKAAISHGSKLISVEFKFTNNGTEMTTCGIFGETGTDSEIDKWLERMKEDKEKEDKKTENMIAIEATTKNKVGFDTYA